MTNSAVRCHGRLVGWAAAPLLTLVLLALPGSAAAATLGLSASSASIGQTIQATAELSEAENLTGTIAFEVFGPGDPTCAGPALSPAPTGATVAGNGSYPSGTFTPTVAGTYHWTAHYTADSESTTASAVCAASSSVAKATPALSGSASSAVIGGSIKSEVTLPGAFSPTAEVTFKVFGPSDPTCAAAALATDTAPIVAGKATAEDFTAPSPGEYHWTASYPGDANNDPVAETSCGAVGQSTVSKATPLLVGAATSAVKVGLTITDNVTVSGAVVPSGELIFRAFGPGDPTCASPPAFEKAVPFAGGNGSYAPAEPFEPLLPGLYLWTVAYAGDANNLPASIACGTAGQESAVGTLDVTLAASAPGGTVGSPLTAAVTLGNGATPGGQLTFKAFAPGDATCSGAPAFSSTVAVKGNGAYGSAPFAPGQVGTYRWTVAYSGDVKHAAASTGCAAASSAVAKANPTIAGKVGQKLTVGTRFRDTATLAGGFAPGGTITFEIYLPGADRCDKPDFVNTVAVNGNGTYSSDPFVAKQAGRYRFVARYSGDASNQAATEACGSPDQLALVGKRTPKLRPLAKLIGPQQISIRARLAGASSPTGVVSFRLFAPGDRRCSGRPAFAGSIRVRKNGTFNLAEYIATEPGVYRLGIAYSGDARNAKTKIACAGTQPIAVRG